MNFTLSDKQVYWRDRVVNFLDEHIYPAVPVFNAQMLAFGTDRWQPVLVPVLVVEALKAKAKPAGLCIHRCRAGQALCRHANDAAGRWARRGAQRNDCAHRVRQVPGAQAGLSA